MALEAKIGKSASRTATSYAAAMRSASGTTRHATPTSCSAAASYRSPRNSISRALSNPTRAGRSDVTAPVTKMLSDTSGKNPLAVSAQIGKSQLMAHSNPPPTAQPLIAPTTSFGPKMICSVAR